MGVARADGEPGADDGGTGESRNRGANGFSGTGESRNRGANGSPGAEYGISGTDGEGGEFAQEHEGEEGAGEI